MRPRFSLWMINCTFKPPLEGSLISLYKKNFLSIFSLAGWEMVR